MKHTATETFWPWYVRSARTDGVAVRFPRRVFNILIMGGMLAAWWLWMAHANSFVTNTMRTVAMSHPLFAAGVVLAFLLMGFRGIALDFMAYRIHAVENIQLRRGIFSSERKLRKEYQRVFGRDAYYRMPEILGASSVLVLAISGFAMVFSSR